MKLIIGFAFEKEMKVRAIQSYYVLFKRIRKVKENKILSALCTTYNKANGPIIFISPMEYYKQISRGFQVNHHHQIPTKWFKQKCTPKQFSPLSLLVSKFMNVFPLAFKSVLQRTICCSVTGCLHLNDWGTSYTLES